MHNQTGNVSPCLALPVELGAFAHTIAEIKLRTFAVCWCFALLWRQIFGRKLLWCGMIS